LYGGPPVRRQPRPPGRRLCLSRVRSLPRGLRRDSRGDVHVTSGPDEPGIKCYEPDTCCGPSPCDATEDEFVCHIRTLLPEGEPWNNTRPTERVGTDQETGIDFGVIAVGCAHVGCEQLILGGCCRDRIICED